MSDLLLFFIASVIAVVFFLIGLFVGGWYVTHQWQKSMKNNHRFGKQKKSDFPQGTHGTYDGPDTPKIYKPDKWNHLQ